MTVLKLTPKQKLFLEFLAQFEVQHGYAPSQQEIAKHFGFKSLGTVQDYLTRLEEQGALQKTWNARRSTSVTAKATAKLATTTSSGSSAAASGTAPLPFALSLPIEGKVAAGRPIEAISQQKSIDVPATLIPARFQKQVTALQVVGDSMIEDGILEDDFVIIRRQESAENGQTVVALLGGTEATIKRYYRKSGRIELHSANSKYKPIIVDPSSDRAEGFRIAGVLVALFRKF
jgi:repressor LexA